MSERLQNGTQTSTQVGNYNTYVGARYVPLIDGEWDANKNYEPLTIVINQGNSYTSAQYVPKGVPLQNNGPYWFKTGNFNGQISSIQEEIIKNSINIGNIENNISDINAEINASKSGLLVIGNSYTIGGIAEQVGGKYDSFQHSYGSGAGFIGDEGHSSFLSNLQEQIGDLNKDNVTEILISSATGETRAIHSGKSSDIPSAMSAFSTYCYEQFPNLKHIYLALTEIRNQQNFNWSNFNDLYVANNLLEYYSPQYNINYLGWVGWPLLFNVEYVLSDNYHPSPLGTKILSQNIINALNGNFIMTPYVYLVNVTKDWGNSVTGRFYASFSILPDYTLVTPYLINLEHQLITSKIYKPFTFTEVIPNIDNQQFINGSSNSGSTGILSFGVENNGDVTIGVINEGNIPAGEFSISSCILPRSKFQKWYKEIK